MALFRALPRELLSRSYASPHAVLWRSSAGRFATEAAEETKKDGGGLFSWVKDVFKSKRPPKDAESSEQKMEPQAGPKETKASPEVHMAAEAMGATHTASESAAEASVSLLAIADEIRKARRLGTLAQFFKMGPQIGGESVNQAFDKYEKILGALANHDPTGQSITAIQKADVATECGCSPSEIDNVIAKYEVMKKAYTKVQEMQNKGERIPQTMEEMQKFLGGILRPSNGASPSNLGVSGKPFKRSYFFLSGWTI